MPVRLHSVGLFVEDMARMVAFYRDAVGMDLQWDGEDPHVLRVQGSVRFMLYGRRDFEAMAGRKLGSPAGVNGSFQLGIDLPDPAAVDETFAGLCRQGATPVMEPSTYHWQTASLRSAFVADPEGNLLELSSGAAGE